MSAATTARPNDGLHAALARFCHRRLQPRRIRGVCATVLIAVAALVGVSLGTKHRGQSLLGPAVGADFAAFYTTGVLLDEGRPDRIYDFWSQHQRLHELFPGTFAKDESLPFAYPPYFTLPLAALARLPYPAALLCWTLASLALFTAGLALLLRAAPESLAKERVTILLLLLAFEPVVVETLIGGQSSALGFFCLALAVFLTRTARPFAAGLALSVCLYKPTLLVLIGPMLLVSRQFRALAGFATGAAALAALSLLALGFGTCRAWVRMLTGFAQHAGAHTPFFRTWKYVDAGAFVHLLFPGIHSTVTAVVVIVPGMFLLRFWWRNRANPSILWAATLTWTLLINLYVPIYDAAIIAIPAILTADAVYRSSNRLPRTFKAILIFLWLTPWLSQQLAQAVGFQPFSLVLAALGVYQLRLSAHPTSLGLATSIAIIRPFALVEPVEPQAANHLEGSFPRRAGPVLGRDGDPYLRAG